MRTLRSKRTLPVRVKICGVTRMEDALQAVALGADALGFNFWRRSKRYCAPAVARQIIRALPPFVTAVGVFVNPERDEVERIAERVGLGWVQLHGDEPPRLCRSLALPVLKALRVEGPLPLTRLSAYPVGGFLLDAPGPGFGGSGHTFEWGWARAPARRWPVLLAGGLTPDNVAEAVRRVRPYGVDVASGVESAPGVKDRHKMARFIRAAKEAL